MIKRGEFYPLGDHLTVVECRAFNLPQAGGVFKQVSIHTDLRSLVAESHQEAAARAQEEVRRHYPTAEGWELGSHTVATGVNVLPDGSPAWVGRWKKPPSG